MAKKPPVPSGKKPFPFAKPGKGAPPMKKGAGCK